MVVTSRCMMGTIDNQRRDRPSEAPGIVHTGVTLCNMPLSEINHYCVLQLAKVFVPDKCFVFPKQLIRENM